MTEADFNAIVDAREDIKRAVDELWENPNSNTAFAVEGSVAHLYDIVSLLRARMSMDERGRRSGEPLPSPDGCPDCGLNWHRGHCPDCHMRENPNERPIA